VFLEEIGHQVADVARLGELILGLLGFEAKVLLGFEGNLFAVAAPRDRSVRLVVVLPLEVLPGVDVLRDRRGLRVEVRFEDLVDALRLAGRRLEPIADALRFEAQVLAPVESSPVWWSRRRSST